MRTNHKKRLLTVGIRRHFWRIWVSS